MPALLRYPSAMAQTSRILVKIYKLKRTLQVWCAQEKLAEYPIALGSQPLGHKLREGDGCTPEGRYTVCVRNEASKYHLALGLTYPNIQDADTALAEGRIAQDQRDAICEAIAAGRRPPWDTPLGGAIMIHGGGAQSDWTAGCIALNNDDMDQLWAWGALGTPVEIEP